MLTHTHRTEPGVDGITNANFFKNLFIMGDGGGEETGKFFFWLMIDDRLYSAILRSLEQTHCARLWFYMSD